MHHKKNGRILCKCRVKKRAVRPSSLLSKSQKMLKEARSPEVTRDRCRGILRGIACSTSDPCLRQFTHNLIVHHARVALSRHGNCEVGKYLAEQKWKGVPHSLGPPPDFAGRQSRRKSHNLFREVPQRESARVPRSKIPVELLSKT